MNASRSCRERRGKNSNKAIDDDDDDIKFNDDDDLAFFTSNIKP